MLCFFTFLYKYFFNYFRSISGPLNISIKQVRMFQTVPDTSSYVKVRHDSIFKQVMSKITILQNSQSLVLVENLIPVIIEFSRKFPSSFVLESQLSQLSFWKLEGLNQSCIIRDQQDVQVVLSFLMHWRLVWWVVS